MCDEKNGESVEALPENACHFVRWSMTLGDEEKDWRREVYENGVIHYVIIEDVTITASYDID